MVQGLAFLSKKSWHTKNLANQEKVWMAEQQKAAEESKTKELARQIAQEREEEELDRISGRKSNRLDRGIDWMYQGGTGEAAQEEAKKQAEEYLLGKEYVPSGGGKGGDFEEGGDTGINTIVRGPPLDPGTSAPPPIEAAASIATAYDEGPSVADRNESFRMRHEDPMFAVSQKQREKNVQIEKKKALYERVVGTGDAHTRSGRSRDDRKSHKSARREAKKERKRQRKRARALKSEADDDGERKRRRRSRSRSRSRDRESRRSDRDREYRDHSSRDRRRRRSRSYSRERQRYDRPLHHSYSSEDSYGKDERLRHGRDRKTCYRSPGHEVDMGRPSGYGLQGTASSSGRSSGGGDLGPRKDLLDKKRQEQESARRIARKKTSTRSRMTDHERAAALRDMQTSADQRDAFLYKAASRKAQSGAEEERCPEKREAAFLNEVHQRSSKITLASRVAQNRHTNQNVNDSFM